MWKPYIFITLSFFILVSLPCSAKENTTDHPCPPCTFTTQQKIDVQLTQLEQGHSTDIDLSSTHITENEISDFVKRLLLIPHSTLPCLSLFFMNSCLDSHAARTLAYALPHFTSLTGLVLSKMKAPPDGVTAFIKALPLCKNLYYLNLSFLTLEEKDICFLTHCKNLKTLDLRGCNITDSSLQKLSPALMSLSNLYFLDLSNNPIGDAGAQALINYLTSFPATSLQMLYLVNTPHISLSVKRALVKACNSKKIILCFGGKDVYSPDTQKFLRDAAIYWKGRHTPANTYIPPVLFSLSNMASHTAITPYP